MSDALEDAVSDIPDSTCLFSINGSKIFASVILTCEFFLGRRGISLSRGVARGKGNCRGTPFLGLSNLGGRLRYGIFFPIFRGYCFAGLRAKTKRNCMRCEPSNAIEFLLYVSEIVAASRTRRERGILIEIGGKKISGGIGGKSTRNIYQKYSISRNSIGIAKRVGKYRSFQYHSIEKFFQKSKKQSAWSSARKQRRTRNRHSTPPILIGVEIRFGIYSSDDESKGSTTRNSLPVLSSRGKHSVQSLPALLLNFTRVYARVSHAWRERTLTRIRTYSLELLLSALVRACVSIHAHTHTRVRVRLDTRSLLSPSFVRSFVLNKQRAKSRPSSPRQLRPRTALQRFSRSD